MDAAREKLSRHSCLSGSALILTVVLTSLLAIVGVMFLMISRIDRMATSAISEDKQLDLAVDGVVAKISAQLAWDVPGVNVPGWGLPEYHDYPGPEDGWLACSEPYQVVPGGPYFWRHISDIYGKFGPFAADLPAVLIPDYQAPSDVDEGRAADADGDGISDAYWVIVPGITSSKGEPVYAAVRVTDNGGKINVNTAFEFYYDPCFPPPVDKIDGTSLWHINLMAFAGRGTSSMLDNETALLEARANYGIYLDPNDLDLYEDNVSWQYGELTMPYTPFDISDELELRNRYLLNNEDIFPRIEQLGDPDEWKKAFRIGLEVPVGSASGGTLNDWLNHADISRAPTTLYDYRHLATTYSMDRIITPRDIVLPGPRGSTLYMKKMVNVNRDDMRTVVYEAIRLGLEDGGLMLSPLAAEEKATDIVVNMMDYMDDDTDVSMIFDSNNARHYGFERPCIYISEVAGIYMDDANGISLSYAVELYKPYFEDDIPVDGGWQLQIGAASAPIDVNWTGNGRFHVILFEPPGRDDLGRVVSFNDPNEALYAAEVPGYSVNLNPIAAIENFVSFPGKTIYLRRSAPFGTVTVDSWTPPPGDPPIPGVPRSFRRDISPHKCVRKLWDGIGTTVTLGRANGFTHADTQMVQAHPYLDPNVYTDSLTGQVGFKNIGEISKVFAKSGYDVPVGSTAADLLLDFRNPAYTHILNYLTVLDPTGHGSPPLGSTETRIKGRININTAPSFVLAQLPWMAPPAVGSAIADMVVAYRDVLVIGSPAPDFRLRGYRGFRSIGELVNVWDNSLSGYAGMDFYADPAYSPGDQDGFPDLTPSRYRMLVDKKPVDDAVDDYEERDLIFHRLSNLVTVRSDVFTAYILVRLGADGPQRRVLAILDRSDVVPAAAPPYTTGKVKIHALHKVADPW